MADDELEAIRAQRMAELQAQMGVRTGLICSFLFIGHWQLFVCLSFCYYFTFTLYFIYQKVTVLRMSCDIRYTRKLPEYQKSENHDFHENLRKPLGLC